jgi:hypothetical protein
MSTQPQHLPLPIPMPLDMYRLRRAMRRAEKKGLPAEWQLRQAVLEQIRGKLRIQARNETGRNSARGICAYVCTPEGRRVVRAIAMLNRWLS